MPDSAEILVHNLIVLGGVLLGALAVAGAVLYWLPYHVPRLVTRRLGGDPDVASTYKLGIGLLVYPTWAALVVTLAFVLLPVERAVALTVLATQADEATARRMLEACGHSVKLAIVAIRRGTDAAGPHAAGRVRARGSPGR